MNQHFTCSAAFVLILFVVSLSGQSAELTIDAPTVVKPDGGDFIVVVSIDKVENMIAYDLELRFYYDASPVHVFRVTATDEGALFADRNRISGDTASGRFSFLTSGSVSGSGQLATFLVMPDAEAKGEFHISLNATLLTSDAKAVKWVCEPASVVLGASDSASSPPARTEATTAWKLPGPVSILDCKDHQKPVYGDLNGDGVVDVQDMSLARQFRGLKPMGHLEFADVNVDGVLDDADIGIIAAN